MYIYFFATCSQWIAGAKFWLLQAFSPAPRYGPLAGPCTCASLKITTSTATLANGCCSSNFQNIKYN